MIDLQNHFDCIFEHLGREAVYVRRNGQQISILALYKQPENYYSAGTTDLVGQISEISIKVKDVPAVLHGDRIKIGQNLYKIFEEPLLDNSNLVWKINAVLEEKA